MNLLTLTEFQNFSGLSDSSLSSFLKEYGKTCQLDKQKGILIDIDAVDIQEALKHTYEKRKQDWHESKEVLLSMTKRVLTQELEQLMEEALDPYIKKGSSDPQKSDG